MDHHMSAVEPSDTTGTASHSGVTMIHVMHQMVFHFSKSSDLLFESLSTDRIGYTTQLLVCIAAGFFGVLLKLLRHMVEIRLLEVTSIPSKQEEKESYFTTVSKMLGINVCRTLIVVLTLSWDYALMLAVMSMNVGIFLSVIAGVAVGFLICGHLFTLPYKNLLIRSNSMTRLSSNRHEILPDSLEGEKPHCQPPWNVTIEPVCCTSI